MEAIRMEAFDINTLNSEDATSLNLLILSNVERFKRYFPKTMAANMTVADLKLYIVRKAKEYLEKSEYTFALRDATQRIAGLIIKKKN